MLIFYELTSSHSVPSGKARKGKGDGGRKEGRDAEGSWTVDSEESESGGVGGGGRYKRSRLKAVCRKREGRS